LCSSKDAHEADLLDEEAETEEDVDRILERQHDYSPIFDEQLYNDGKHCIFSHFTLEKCAVVLTTQPHWKALLITPQPCPFDLRINAC